MGADLARVFVACGAACAVGACTLTVSTSGLTGGGGATSEAGAGDASVNDAPSVADAASDADVVTEAGPVTFCKQKTHTLCADFDDASWTSKFRTLLRNGGSVADTTDHVSPPSSGLCSVPPSGVKEVSARIAADLPNGGRGEGHPHAHGGRALRPPDPRRVHEHGDPELRREDRQLHGRRELISRPLAARYGPLTSGARSPGT